MKNMLDILVGGVMYWVCGWALAHGSGGTAFSGGGNFFTKNLPAEMYPIFFFDYMFASTAITIVSGSIAERCPILAYMVYSVVISGKSNLQIVNQILSFAIMWTVFKLLRNILFFKAGFIQSLRIGFGGGVKILQKKAGCYI